MRTPEAPLLKTTNNRLSTVEIENTHKVTKNHYTVDNNISPAQ